MKKLNLIIFLLLTTIITGASAIYLFVMAEERFVSTSHFTVVVEEQNGADIASGLDSLLGSAPTGNTETQTVLGFIASADLLIELEKEFNLHTHYSTPKHDYIFRLKKDASLEDRLKYYRKKITAQINSTTSLLDLEIQTYSAELSYEVAKFILGKTEEFINKQNQDIAEEQLEFANKELIRAQEIIRKQERKLLNFQNQHQIIQPEAIIQAQLEAIQTLRLSKINREVELATIKAASPNSPLLKDIKTAIHALNKEIQSQEESLSGEDQQKLNNLLAEYKEITLDLEFAIGLKGGIEALLETTRAEAASNTRFFSVIQNPYLPEEKAYPRRWYLLASIFVIASLSLLLLKAVFKSIFDRE